MSRLERCLAGLVLLLAGCGTTGPGDGDIVILDAAEERWQAEGPGSYVFAIRRNCFCALEWIGPARLSVENGIVVESVYVDSGLPVPDGFEFPTVDALFELVRAAYEADADQVTVTYDPQLGVPTEAWIDYSEMTADEELGWLVTEPVTAIP